MATRRPARKASAKQAAVGKARAAHGVGFRFSGVTAD
jgi:hypothetical protein